MSFISDAEVERALDYLRDESSSIAQARADRVYAEEYRKSLKAILMNESEATSAAMKESEAYAHPKYLDHLKSLKAAVFEDERRRALREAASMKIDAWRTQSASERSFKL